MNWNLLFLITWIILIGCILFTIVLIFILFHRLKIVKQYEQSSHIAQIIIDEHLYEEQK